jgi:hypothetical protein
MDLTGRPWTLLVIILSPRHEGPCVAQRPREGTAGLHKGRLSRYYGDLEGPRAHERLRQKCLALRAHNPKVAGSNPAPATNESAG